MFYFSGAGTPELSSMEDDEQVVDVYGVTTSSLISAYLLAIQAGGSHSLIGTARPA